MRDLPSEITNSLNQRQGLIVRTLWWVEARNRTTGEVETLGIWNGEDVQNFVVDGENRTYYGGGAFLQFEELKQESMLHIRSLRALASPISPEMETVLRTYEPKFAPVQVHLAFFSPETNNLLAPPHRVFKGWINKAPINTPAKNGVGQARIEMVGHTRLLTKKTPVKRSNESQRKRSSTDTFFKDVTMTGTVITPWGSEGVAGGGRGGGGDFRGIDFFKGKNKS